MTVALRLGSLALAVCAAMLLGLFVGGSALPAASVAWTLLHPHASGDVATIVWQLRAPRVCIAALVGAAPPPIATVFTPSSPQPNLRASS